MSRQEVRTEPLSIDELRESVAEMVDFLALTGHLSIVVTHGWGCELPADKLWNPMQIDTTQLGSFIQQNVQNKIFAFGRSDLHIEDLKGILEFRLCHESDIHFGSDDQSLVERVIELWKQKGRTLYVSQGPLRTAAATEWTRV